MAEPVTSTQLVWEEFFNRYMEDELYQLMMHYPEQKHLSIDVSLLELYSCELFEEILEMPIKVIEIACTALNDFLICPTVNFFPKRTINFNLAFSPFKSLPIIAELPGYKVFILLLSVPFDPLRASNGVTPSWQERQWSDTLPRTVVFLSSAALSYSLKVDMGLFRIN